MTLKQAYTTAEKGTRLNTEERIRVSAGRHRLRSVSKTPGSVARMNHDSESIQSLLRFVPIILRAELLASCHRAVQGQLESLERDDVCKQHASVLGADGSGQLPTLIPTMGAIMIADIAGFTSLTESLGASQGAIGVEMLTNVMNNFFSRIIDIVHSHGTDAQ
jgi:hypothetical protein